MLNAFEAALAQKREAEQAAAEKAAEMTAVADGRGGWVASDTHGPARTAQATRKAAQRRDDLNAKGRADMETAQRLARDPGQRSAAAWYRARATRRFNAADRHQRTIDEAGE